MPPVAGSKARRYLSWAALVVIMGGLAWWFYPREVPAVRLFREGRQLQAQGQTLAAIGRYEQALAADPSRVEIRFFLGQCLLSERRIDDAIAHSNAPVTAGIRKDAAPFELARALAATGQYEAAKRSNAASAGNQRQPPCT